MTTREVLDALVARGCGVADCDHAHHAEPLFLHARCHLDGRIEVSYRHGSGVLRIGCRECGKVIAQVAVAYGDPPDLSD
jgi:hypothetical protein